MGGERDPERCERLDGESEYSRRTERESGETLRLLLRLLDGDREKFCFPGLLDLLRDLRRFRSRSRLEDETTGITSSSPELPSSSLENLSRSFSRALSNSLSRSLSLSLFLDLCLSASLSFSCKGNVRINNRLFSNHQDTVKL